MIQKLDDMEKRDDSSTDDDNSSEPGTIENRRTSVFLPIDEQVEDSLGLLEEFPVSDPEPSRTSSLKRNISGASSQDDGNQNLPELFEKEGEGQEDTLPVESDVDDDESGN